jgi:phosphoribosylanthranilate isomerase
MPLIVKICGLSTAEAVDAAIEQRADMVGFVFFEPSPRHLAFEAARALGIRVNGRARKVALSVDADDELLTAIVGVLSPDYLQLHGKESPARVGAIKARFHLPVIKALAIEARADFAQVKNYARAADWILLDAKAPGDATRPGGLGKPFDWALLSGAMPGVPTMLSGGLDAENIEQALRMSGVAAVDVSSGVEIAPGKKDPEKIRQFIRAAHAAYARLSPQKAVNSR